MLAFSVRSFALTFAFRKWVETLVGLSVSLFSYLLCFLFRGENEGAEIKAGCVQKSTPCGKWELSVLIWKEDFCSIYLEVFYLDTIS